MTESGVLEYSTPEPQPPKGAISIIFLIVLMDLFGFGVIIPLLPLYARKFSASNVEVGLLFSIFSACQLIATPILGLMSDRFGRRPVLVLSQLGSVTGYLLLGFATGTNWAHPAVGLGLIYLSRIIDGVSGGNISTAQAYIADVTSKETRARAMGILGAAFGIGFSIGPAVGGVLGHFNVALPAFAAALFSLIAAAQTYLRLPETRVHKTDVQSEAWLHPRQFMPLLREPVLVQLLLISFLSMMAFVMMESIYTLFLSDTFHFGSLALGSFFALAGLVIVVVQGGLIGRLNKRFGEWPLAIVGPMLVCLAMLMYMLAGFHVLVIFLLLGTLCNATGRSLQTPNLSTLVSHHSDPSKQGTVFGLFHGLGSLARVIGPMIATATYAAGRSWPPYMIAGSIMAIVVVWTIGVRASGQEAVVAPA